jgi:hypothetical protein
VWQFLFLGPLLVLRQEDQHLEACFVPLALTYFEEVCEFHSVNVSDQEKLSGQGMQHM